MVNNILVLHVSVTTFNVTEIRQLVKYVEVFHVVIIIHYTLQFYCTGPQRGVCSCDGQCECLTSPISGLQYTGSACDCDPDNATCISPGAEVKEYLTYPFDNICIYRLYVVGVVSVCADSVCVPQKVTLGNFAKYAQIFL